MKRQIDIEININEEKIKEIVDKIINRRISKIINHIIKMKKLEDKIYYHEPKQ
jgi:hypothetical protein